MRLKSLVEYLQLTKPKVTLLNLLVAVTCFLLAVYPKVDWMNLAAFMVVGYAAAGGCGVLNSAYDRDIDSLMSRTVKRAIPSGRVSAKNAFAIGITMIAASLAASILFFNILTALIMSLGAVFYLLIYTFWLKRVSPWNVVIGGLAGCFAGLSGWTATGATLTWIPLLVASVDFLWTPGHLWSLAIKKVDEYRKAGVPMLPVALGVSKASKIVFWLNVATVASSLALVFFGVEGTIYLVVALASGIMFLMASVKLLTLKSEEQGFHVFLFSMPYLMCLMFGLIADKIFFIV